MQDTGGQIGNCNIKPIHVPCPSLRAGPTRERPRGRGAAPRGGGGGLDSEAPLIGMVEDKWAEKCLYLDPRLRFGTNGASSLGSQGAAVDTKDFLTANRICRIRP